MKPKADETILVTVLQHGEQERFEAILSNFDFETHYDVNTDMFRFMLHTKGIPTLKGELEVILLLTDDPTPTSAMSWVSMGYYTLRLSLTNCKMVSTDPPTFEGKRKNFNRIRSLPLR